MKKSHARLVVAIVIWGVGSFLFLVILDGCNATATTLPTVVPVAQLSVEEGVGTTIVNGIEATNTPVNAGGDGEDTAVSSAHPQSAKQENPKIEPTETFAAFGVRVPLGQSVEGRTIEAFRFGFGTDVIIFVGGMHGGYEWNTILLAYEAIDYFVEHPEVIPSNVSLYIIPSANPDGQYWATEQNGRFQPEDVAQITIPGRFNANEVDLNRNWDCEWQAEANWNGRQVDAGSEPFSEPETKILRRFFLRQSPEVVLFWHSKADGIYAGGCGDDAFADSLALGEIYADAADYNVHEAFTAYEITGEASDWLTTQDIPSFTVELTVHDETEWAQNLAGMLAMLEHFGD